MADASDAAAMIAADPALVAEARALLPAFEAAIAPAGAEGVRAAVSPLLAVYPQTERSRAEWALWWAQYVEDLAGFCPDILAQAVREFRRRPAARFMPTPGELRALALTARIKPIGAGHSFTAIGVTDGVQLRPEGLTGIVSADRSTGLVTVSAGTRLHDLNDALWEHGLSMTNLGDIDVQTSAGAISTGTHGTGAKLGCSATQ